MWSHCSWVCFFSFFSLITLFICRLVLGFFLWEVSAHYFSHSHCLIMCCKLSPGACSLMQADLCWHERIWQFWANRKKSNQTMLSLRQSWVSGVFSTWGTEYTSVLFSALWVIAEQLWQRRLTPLSDVSTNEYEIIKLSFISEVLRVLRGQPF